MQAAKPKTVAAARIIYDNFFEENYDKDFAKIYYNSKLFLTNLKDYNNPVDIAIPIIKFEDDTYKVVSIDDINYKHFQL